MQELPFAGEHHGQAELVGASDDGVVPHRPARLYDGVSSPLADPGSIDMLCIREGTEGPYVGNGGVLNRLRYRDEFVRHKVLDLVGDLALLGRPVLGHVVARNAGHALNYQLVLAIQQALGLERRPATITAAQPAASQRLSAAPAIS